MTASRGRGRSPLAGAGASAAHEGKSESAPPPAADVPAADSGCGWPLALIAAAGAVTMAAHVLGSGVPRGVLWGAHFYAFLPAWALTVGLAVVAAAALAALTPRGRALVATVRVPDVEAGPRARRRRVMVAIMMGAAALFWLFRTRHLLLGDGLPLTARVLEGGSFHPLEPLTAWLQARVHALARRLFATPGAPSWRVAWDALALGSVVAGALFVPVAWALARELAAARAGATAALVLLVLLAQGYVQLFFGYVENYTWYTLALACYLLAALRHLGGRWPLAAPGAALVLALALHLSAAAMMPSFAVLAARGLMHRAGRARALRGLALTAAFFATASLALARLHPGYSLGRSLLDVGRAIGEGSPAQAAGYALSARHWRDFLNEQLLIGPLGLFLFLPAALATARAWRDPRVAFALAAGAGYLAACWIAGDSNLGYARNWDLLAPSGLVFATGALLLLLRAAPGGLPGGALVLALAVSLFHTVPWVAVNACERRALARFETLPLGLGRVESTLGYWQALNGRPVEAERWLRQAVEVAPGNVRAWGFLGKLEAERGRFAPAARAYAEAVRLRPDVPEYRRGLAQARERLAVGPDTAWRPRDDGPRMMQTPTHP
ncbi:MAG: hypothetical protein HZC42_15745 [Candidatus Eisenbacteria bacterium]|nr:hypothetical protein [Candidatus Eisenbacteria bacterium]